LSIATAINPFPPTLFSGKDLGIHISLNQQFSILETNNRTFKTFNGLISLLVSYQKQKLMRTFWSTFNFLYKKLRNAICISKFYANGNFSLFFDYLFPSLWKKRARKGPLPLCGSTAISFFLLYLPKLG
jgi:hypothetical protein